MKYYAQRIVVVLSALLVLGFLFSVCARGYRSFVAQQEIKAKLKQDLLDAQASTKTWADRLDGQTTKAGVYIRVNNQSESDLSENDPWGKPFKVIYSKGGIQEILKVICLGPDGKQGTRDDIEEKRQVTNFSGLGSGLKDSLTPDFLKKKGKDAIQPN